MTFGLGTCPDEVDDCQEASTGNLNDTDKERTLVKLTLESTLDEMDRQPSNLNSNYSWSSYDGCSTSEVAEFRHQSK
jgi:hypothetical protein